MIRWRSIRLRLAIYHAAAMAIVLVAFAAGTYAWIERTSAARTDRSLAETTRAFTELWEHELSEIQGAAAGAVPLAEVAAADAVREFHFRDRRVLVLGHARRFVASSDDESAPGDPAIPPFAELEPALARAAPGMADRPETATIRAGDGELRVRSEPVRIGGMPFTIVAVESLARERAALAALARTLLLAVPLALLVATAGGYLVARASLAPAVTLGEQAGRIGAGSLHERLVVANPADELGRLAAALNGLLSRLDQAFEQQRRFMTDASHELRTPVAIVRTSSEVALSRADRPAGELRDALELVRLESRRLSRIVEDLFLMARADAGRQPVRVGELYLDELLADRVRAARALAEPRGVTLELAAAAETATRGDESLLGRLVMNLLENAIRHTPAGGRVRVSLTADDALRRIEVRDGGAGIPEDARGRIFDRFFRADAPPAPGEDSARSGAGLGLPIARWIAEAHGGSLVLAKSGPGGSAFVVTLPREGPREGPRAEDRR